jgi:hypothetical protein
MKKELDCNIVQDLLPNYIEKLTRDDTNHAIELHLDTCEECKKAYEDMVYDIESLEKIPVIELKFLKKVKKIRLLAAMICIILTIVVSYMIYVSEYTFINDKCNLAEGITEFIYPFREDIDAYVLETKEIDDMLIVSFKDLTSTNVNGIAIFVKGFNQRYRIIHAKIEASEYSSVLQVFSIEIKNEPYYILSGYNLSDKIKHYGLDYYAYLNPGDLSKDRVKKSIKFDVENQQFLEIYNVEELNSLFENSVEETLYNPRLAGTSMYDADGKEITEKFMKYKDVSDKGSSVIGKAELFVLYIFIAIVIGIGFIFTRYFLTE